MDNYEVAKIVKKHLAKDFNCTENDFDSYKIVVTELKESGNKAMKAACFGGSAIFSVLPKWFRISNAFSKAGTRIGFLKPTPS